MRTTTLVLCGLVAFLSLGSCIIAIGPGLTDGVHTGWGWSGKRGSGVSATQTRALSAFHAIRIEGSCDVNATVGGEQSVAVTADDNLIDDLTTSVEDGVLVISMREHSNVHFRVGPTATVNVPGLDGLCIEGSGDADVQGVDGESFTAKISGSGDIRMRGRTAKLVLGLEGSGDADLAGLECQDATVSIEGSGDVRLRCSKSLNASISGSGDIGYIGSPEVVNSINGSGDVHPIH